MSTPSVPLDVSLCPRLGTPPRPVVRGHKVLLGGNFGKMGVPGPWDSNKTFTVGTSIGFTETPVRKEQN